MNTVPENREMAKKETDATARKYANLVRVSAEFAEALNDAARMEKMSAGEFADTHLLPTVRKRYRETVLKEAKRVGGSEK
jgi:hypothetical protein